MILSKAISRYNSTSPSSSGSPRRRVLSRALVWTRPPFSMTGRWEQITNARNFSDLVATGRLLRPFSFQLGKEWLSRKWITFSMTRPIAREFSEKSLCWESWDTHVLWNWSKSASPRIHNFLKHYMWSWNSQRVIWKRS